MGTVPSERGSWAGGVLLADTYLLGRRISRGGMGEVFEATHARLPGRYAVKILLPELTGHREAFARFCREAEVMSELRHPNVVQIFDFNTTPDGRPYFVMEFLEGRDLETRLTDAGPVTLPFAVRIVDSVASALAAAHAHGIVHRDLKPANIFLVTVDGQADELIKVLDFGISKVRAAGTLLSMPTDMLGTPPYMSPEQARGATHLIDGRTDQFALGAIAFRMLTGHDPFTGSDIASLLYQVVHQDPPPLAHYVPASWDTRALQAVLNRAMAKDPGQRWTSMVDLARAFEAASEQTLSRLPPEAGAVDLAATLIAAPPPPPAATEPERPALTPTPVVQPLVAAPPARAGTPNPIPIGMEPTSPALITDEPPPIRTPGPVVLPPAETGPVAVHPAAARPVAAASRPPEPAVALTELGFAQRSRRGRSKEPSQGSSLIVREPVAAAPRTYDWEPVGSIDYVPRHHTGLIVFGVLLGAVALWLAVTGSYRRIPAVVTSVSRAIHHPTAPTTQPTQPAAPAPAAAPAASAPAAPPAAAAPAAQPPAQAPAPATDAPAPKREDGDRPAHEATTERPRHERRRSSGVRFVDHPGSIDLSPPSSGPGTSAGENSAPAPARDRANPFLVAPSPPPAAAAPTPQPASPGFNIEPASPTTDTPAHDIAPAPSGDEDQPLPPSVH